MLRNLTKLALYNTTGPLIIFLSTPIVSRIYEPSIVGEYYLIFSYSAFLAIGIGLAIDNAIVAENVISRVHAIYRESMGLIFLLCMVAQCALAIVIIIFSEITDESINMEYLWIAPLAALLALAKNATALLSRLGQTKLLGRMLIAKSILLVFLQIFGGTVIDPKLSLLLVATLISEMLFVVMSSVKSKGFFLIFKVKHWKRAMPNKMLTHKMLCVNLLPSQLIATFANTIPYLMLQAYAGAYLIGLYSMCTRLTMSPANALTQAMRSIYWNWSRKDESKIKQGVRLSIMISMSSIAFAIIYWLSDSRILLNYLGVQWLGVDKMFAFVFAWVFTSLGNVLLFETVKYGVSPRIILNTELGMAIAKILAAVASVLVLGLFSIELFCVLAVIVNILVMVYLMGVIKRGLLCL